jgi:hypothetical protein
MRAGAWRPCRRGHSVPVCTAAADYSPTPHGLLDVQGVPWFYESGCNATLLYCNVENTGWAKKAGSPAAAFMIMALGVHLVRAAREECKCTTVGVCSCCWSR